MVVVPASFFSLDKVAREQGEVDQNRDQGLGTRVLMKLDPGFAFALHWTFSRMTPSNPTFNTFDSSCLTLPVILYDSK